MFIILIGLIIVGVSDVIYPVIDTNTGRILFTKNFNYYQQIIRLIIDKSGVNIQFLIVRFDK